jgi:hypothetical protein
MRVIPVKADGQQRFLGAAQGLRMRQAGRHAPEHVFCHAGPDDLVIRVLKNQAHAPAQQREIGRVGDAQSVNRDAALLRLQQPVHVPGQRRLA